MAAILVSPPPKCESVIRDSAVTELLPVCESTPPSTPVDLSKREFEALEQYAQERGLSVDQAASELAHHEVLIRTGAVMRADARVLPFRRR